MRGRKEMKMELFVGLALWPVSFFVGSLRECLMLALVYALLLRAQERRHKSILAEMKKDEFWEIGKLYHRS